MTGLLRARSLHTLPNETPLELVMNMTLLASPDAWGPAALAAVVATLMLMLLWARLRRANATPQRSPREALDTMLAWPAEATRVMAVQERQAYDTLRRALPGHTVLAQVPLSRFLRVPTRHSYSDWLQRVGFVSADLLVCDSASHVLAVVDIRGAGESLRSRRRHERMGEVLQSAGISVLVWQADKLPTAEQVRTQMIPVLQAYYGRNAAPATPQQPPVSKPVPLIPVAEMEELLAAGDAAHAHNDASMEPVPSTLFDEFNEAPVAAAGGARR